MAGLAIIPLFSDGLLAQTSVSGLAPQDLYQDCIRLADSNPDEAFDLAEVWQAENGGPPALHCASLALVNLGHYGAAAERLEVLATTSQMVDEGLRAEIMTQAGNSWLMADAPNRAIDLFSEALLIADPDAALLTDRARAYGLIGAWETANDDLNEALLIDPEYSPAYIYRASARRQLGETALALEDIELAIALNEAAPEAYLERGLLYLGMGDRDGARQDWLETIRLVPDHPFAETARKYLEAMDVKQE